MVSLAKYTITESRANVIVARALFFEHVFLAFLDIFELPATRPRPAALRQLFGSQAPANRLTPAAGSALAHCCARRTAHPSPRARRPPLLHPRDALGTPHRRRRRTPAGRPEAVRPERGPGRQATFRSLPAEAPARYISGKMPGSRASCANASGSLAVTAT